MQWLIMLGRCLQSFLAGMGNTDGLSIDMFDSVALLLLFLKLYFNQEFINGCFYFSVSVPFPYLMCHIYLF